MWNLQKVFHIFILYWSFDFEIYTSVEGETWVHVWGFDLLWKNSVLQEQKQEIRIWSSSSAAREGWYPPAHPHTDVTVLSDQRAAVSGRQHRVRGRSRSGWCPEKLILVCCKISGPSSSCSPAGGGGVLDDGSCSAPTETGAWKAERDLTFTTQIWI